MPSPIVLASKSSSDCTVCVATGNGGAQLAWKPTKTCGKLTHRSVSALLRTLSRECSTLGGQVRAAHSDTPARVNALKRVPKAQVRRDSHRRRTHAQVARPLHELEMTHHSYKSKLALHMMAYLRYAPAWTRST